MKKPVKTHLKSAIKYISFTMIFSCLSYAVGHENSSDTSNSETEEKIEDKILTDYEYRLHQKIRNLEVQIKEYESGSDASKLETEERVEDKMLTNYEYRLHQKIKNLEAQIKEKDTLIKRYKNRAALSKNKYETENLKEIHLMIMDYYNHWQYWRKHYPQLYTFDKYLRTLLLKSPSRRYRQNMSKGMVRETKDLANLFARIRQLSSP